ncbi:MAG: peptidase dimerization domain protein, partial [Flavobacteriales bacterium]
MSACQPYIESNRDRFLEELFELLRIPSVSADPAFAGDVQKCAELVAKQLEAAGGENVEIIPTEGYPVVYGEKLVGPDAPTVLVYGHYDVQPADPLELWDAPAFEPVIKKTDIHPEG